MLDFLSKALEWLKSPKRWSAVLIVCTLLLLLPSSVMQKMGLSEIRQYFLPWISLGAIFSAAVLAVEFGAWLKIPLNSFQEQKNRKAVLLSLTPPEMQIIADYFRKETDTQYFSMEDGIVGGLVAKGLIYLSSNISTDFTTFAYNLQPWVRETIR